MQQPDSQQPDFTMRVADTFGLLEKTFHFRVDRDPGLVFRLLVLKNMLADRVPGTNVSVQYDIDVLNKVAGLDLHTWNVLITGHSYSYSAGPTSNPAVRVSVSYREWLDLMGARVPVSDLVRLKKIQGDHADIENVRALGLLGPIEFCVQYDIEGPDSGT